ncbi:MAG: hypothetical protein QM733_05390 [Ilumatobacteraceae bacterium]
MKRFVRSVCALIAGFLATSGAVVLSNHLSQPVKIRLGRLDMSEYCRRSYGDGAVAQTEKSAFGWYCIYFPKGIYQPVDIDVHTACEVMYGAPARAELSSDDNPYGWECVRN